MWSVYLPGTFLGNCAMYDSQNQYHDVRLEKGNLLDRRPINLLQVHRLQNNHHRNKLK